MNSVFLASLSIFLLAERPVCDRGYAGEDNMYPSEGNSNCIYLFERNTAFYLILSQSST